MSNDFKLGITGAIEPNITFLGGASKEVLRLSKDGIWANPDIPADDAAKLVLAAIDHNIKVMVDKAVNDKLEGAANYIDALGGDSKKYRQTLAQPEQKPVQFKCTVIDDAHPNGIPLAQWAKPQRTDQPEQEPVAWGMPSAAGGFVVDCITPEEHARIEGGYTVPLYTSPPPQQETVAWLLTDKNINSLQVDSIQRLIDRLKHAHHTDLCVRINGQDEWFQADWLKHMVRVAPPQRTWVGLTNEEIWEAISRIGTSDSDVNPYAKLADARAIEAKLKEKNT